MKIIAMYADSRVQVLAAGLLYATCFIVQQWTSYLFTDTLFYMLLIIGVYFLLQENKSRKQRTWFWVFLIMLPFFRPVGFLFVAVACVHWIFNWQRNNVVKLAASLGYLLLLLFFVQRSIVADETYFNPHHNVQAEIICGWPSGLLKYQRVPYKHTSLSEYFLDNPGMAARLFLMRFFKSFSLTRPYFSAVHNLLLAAACVFYYALALVGFINILRKKQRELYFLPFACVMFVLPSVMLGVEWSGRVSLPTFCCMLIMAGIGTSYLVSKYLMVGARNKD